MILPPLVYPALANGGGALEGRSLPPHPKVGGFESLSHCYHRESKSGSTLASSFQGRGFESRLGRWQQGSVL
jgi:hypothetical protein